MGQLQHREQGARVGLLRVYVGNTQNYRGILRRFRLFCRQGT